jgi:hypothetical protein
MKKERMGKLIPHPFFLEKNEKIFIFFEKILDKIY